MKRKWKRFLSILLSLCMAFSLLPATALADGTSVSYVDREWVNNAVVDTGRTASAEPVTSGSAAWGSAGTTGSRSSSWTACAGPFVPKRRRSSVGCSGNAASTPPISSC